ncbi:MAG: heavy metal translocating P-type ATPase [Tannerellaceae bacterium]|jgi:Cu2+-exporting ATPase|nr:heavy metal translocating P-type ATPase [Tannerellaceae bacterium]
MKAAISIPVLNLSCAGCAAAAAQALRKQKGVTAAEVRFADKTARVEYDDDLTTPSLWREAVRRAGYDIIVADDSDTRLRLRDEAERLSFRILGRRTAAALACAAGLVLFGMTPLMHEAWAGYASGMLATFVLIFCGWTFFCEAGRQARNRRVSMNTLVALGSTVAWLYSLRSLMAGHHGELYFETAGVLIAFILTGRWLEEKARRKTSEAIRSLIAIQPRTATLIMPDGSTAEKPLAELCTGDTLWVGAGCRIPADGTVLSGHSFVDESAITGESLAAEKVAGCTVYAGTLNGSGSFGMSISRLGGDTFLAQMIRLTDEARNSAPALRAVDRLVAVFVPAVMAIALVAAVIWLVFGGDAATERALSAFVGVLVIACPCALGLATPLAVMVGIGKGAAQGILIRNMDCLETMRRVNCIILDKTGTITSGRPALARSLWATEATAELRSILYTMELSSAHPLGEAIAASLRGAGLYAHELAVELIPGKGVKAVGEQQTWYAGSAALFPPDIISPEIREWMAEGESEGQSLVVFGTDAQIFALFALADAVKPGSQAAIARLKAMGIRLIMATGDNEAAAGAVARRVGIEEYYAQALPADKLALVRQMLAGGCTVAMAGDGVNDSAALAAAGVGIAMGKGSEAAMETASCIIVSGEPEKICAALRLSEDTVAVIRQNLFWAFLYNALAIPIAAGALYPLCGFLLNPMLAGGAMALSSLSVVLNSLRFNRLGRR